MVDNNRAEIGGHRLRQMIGGAGVGLESRMQIRGKDRDRQQEILL